MSAFGTNVDVSICVCACLSVIADGLLESFMQGSGEEYRQLWLSGRNKYFFMALYNAVNIHHSSSTNRIEIEYLENIWLSNK